MAPAPRGTGETPPRAELIDAGFAPPVRGGFTTRAGGTSMEPFAGLNLSSRVRDDPQAVVANRALLAEAVDVAPDRLVLVRQVHGTQVAVVDDDTARADPDGCADADALVTTTRGLALVVLAADCVPVLLADPRAGVVGAAHAGRVGLATGVLQATVAAMRALGATALDAVVGPAAGACCYEVPAGMVTEVAATVPGSAATTRAGTPSLDLRAGADGLLRDLGVHVRHVAACTVDDPRFYSHRRDAETGRHAGVVVLG